MASRSANVFSTTSRARSGHPPSPPWHSANRWHSRHRRRRITQSPSRHCEPTGRANARPMTGSAKQSSFLCRAMDCPTKIRCRAREPVVDHLGNFGAACERAVKYVVIDTVLREQLGECVAVALFHGIAEGAEHG